MRRIIEVKTKKGIERYSSLKPFYRDYPEYDNKQMRDRISEKMSRKKEAYKDDNIIIERFEVKT